MTQTPIDMMRTLKAELEARLEMNEEFRALKAISAAIDELEGKKTPQAVAHVIQRRQHSLPHSSRRPITQADASALALEEAGKPKTTPELVELVRSHGVHVGGNDPNTNLASSLSRDPRFVALRIDGKSYWWLEGRPLPDENSFMPLAFDGEIVRRSD